MCRLGEKLIHLTLYAPIPQNGQTHSNNSSELADELFVFDHFVGLALPTNSLSVFDHFMGLALKGLTPILKNLFWAVNKI